MAFSLKKLLEGAAAQVNPFDGGKTYSSVVRNQPTRTPAQTPPPQSGNMNFAGSKTYGTFNRPSPVVNAAQKQIAQTPKIDTKTKYAQVNAPSYGSGLSGLLNRARDVVDANTAQDRFKRTQIGQPEVVKPMQQQISERAKPIAQGFVEQYNQLGTGVGTLLAQNSKDVKNAQKAQQDLANQLHQQRMTVIKKAKAPGVTQPQLNRLNNFYNDLNQKDVELQQQRTNQSNDLYSKLDPKKNLAALASVGFDIATLGYGTAGYQGVKQAGKQGFKAGAKELAKQAGITGSMGAVSGGLSPVVQKGDQATAGDIAKGAATGFAFGAALPVATYGVGSGISKVKDPIQNALKNTGKALGDINPLPKTQGGFVDPEAIKNSFKGKAPKTEGVAPTGKTEPKLVTRFTKGKDLGNGKYQMAKAELLDENGKVLESHSFSREPNLDNPLDKQSVEEMRKELAREYINRKHFNDPKNQMNTGWYKGTDTPTPPKGVAPKSTPIEKTPPSNVANKYLPNQLKTDVPPTKTTKYTSGSKELADTLNTDLSGKNVVITTDAGNVSGKVVKNYPSRITTSEQTWSIGGKTQTETLHHNNNSSIILELPDGSRTAIKGRMVNGLEVQSTPIEKTVEQTPFGPVKAKTDPGLDPVAHRTQKVAEMPQKSKIQSTELKPTSKMPTKDSVKASYPDNTPTQQDLPIYETRRVSNLDKAFRSTRSIVERQGEKGKQLAGMLQKQRDNKELYVRDLEKRIPTVQKLKNNEYENFVDATQGQTKPMNPKVEQAVKEWQSVHPEIRDRAVNAGLDVGDLGETYYPHFVDYDRIFKDKNTYNEAINYLVKTGQAETPEKAIELLSYARDVSRNRKFGNLEASRIVDLPFYDKSKASLGMYIDGSADRITKTEMFGKGDENALKLIKEAGQDGYDTEAMKNAYDVAVGAKQYNPTTSKISKGIRQFTTTTRLGLGALTNVSQSVNTGIVTGHLRTMKSIIKQFDPKTRQLAEDTGVISDAILNDLKHGFGAEYNKGNFGKIVNAITAPGFKQVESFNRRVAATAGRDYALRLAQKGDEATLRKLGVTGVIKNNTLTEAQQIQAARKIVEKTQFKVDPQDLPGWTDSPGGKLVAQFRTFSYNQGKFFSNEILKPLAKGNAMPLGRLLAALPLGYGLYEVRRNIDGRPEEDNKTKVGLQSFQKIGGAGLVLDIYQGLNPVGSKYLPSDRRVSMALGTIGGPSIGTTANAVGALSEAIQRKNTPKDESRLGGKVVVGKNENSYSDLTAISRFGMQQVPIIGTAMANRVLPYKKQAEADAGKTLTTQKQAELPREDRMKDAKQTIKNLYGKDWSSLSESEIESKAFNGDPKALEIYNSLKAQEKVYAKPNMPTPGLSKGAEDILNQSKKFTETGKGAWGNRPTESKEAKNALKGWINQDVPVTNDVAVEWAKFEQKRVKGELSPLEENEAKTALLRKAVSSTLNEDEKQLYKLSKTKITSALSEGLITEDNLKKALAVERQMFDNGLLESETLAKKLGLGSRSKSSGSSSRKSSGRKSSRVKSTKVKTTKTPVSFTKVKNRQKGVNSSLRKLLGSAKV